MDRLSPFRLGGCGLFPRPWFKTASTVHRWNTDRFEARWPGHHAVVFSEYAGWPESAHEMHTLVKGKEVAKGIREALKEQ